jgi:hypothetical protein
MGAVKGLLPEPPNPTSDTSVVVFNAMRSTTGNTAKFWWVATARRPQFARIAVTTVTVPTAASAGKWLLVGIDGAGKCIALAEGGGVLNGTIGGATWLAKNKDGGAQPSISFAVRVSPNAVVPADEPLPTCLFGDAATNPFSPRAADVVPPATRDAVAGLVLRSSMPIFGLGAGFGPPMSLVPYASGGNVRWASNPGEGECFYVIDLAKEPEFRVGLSQGDGVSIAYWGLFLYSLKPAGGGWRYRGLAFSTQKTTEPPLSAGTENAWVSAWVDKSSPTATKIGSIPVGLLSISGGASVSPTGDRIAATPQEAPVAWDAPIRLPIFVTTTSTNTVQTVLSLSTYDWHTNLGTEPERTLGTAKWVNENSKNYKPELFKSGVRWFYEGGTFSGETYPDLYVHEYSPSSLADEPTLGSIGAPTNATWIVYSRTPASVFTLKAYTLSPSLVAGIGGTPPALGRLVWECLVPSNPPRRIGFALTARDQTVIRSITSR